MLKSESSVQSNLALVLYKYEMHRGKLSLAFLCLKHNFSMVYFIFPLCIQTFYLFQQGCLQRVKIICFVISLSTVLL